MSSSTSFEKAGECLYRNPSSQQYYALLKIRGKQIKRSLKSGGRPAPAGRCLPSLPQPQRGDPTPAQGNALGIGPAKNQP